MADPKIPLADLPHGLPGAFDRVAGVDTATGAAKQFPMPQAGEPKDYPTRASLPSAAGLPEGTAAHVNNDPTPDNNGRWAVFGGQWVQSADRVTGLEGRVAAAEDGAIQALDVAVAGQGFAELFKLINPFRPYGGANQRAGAVFDFRDRGYLFQDSDGLVPVTEYGQPVGLVRDKAGTGFYLYQDVSADRPMYDVDADGEPCLVFNANAFLRSNIEDPSLSRTQLVVSALEDAGDVREQFILSSSSLSSASDGVRFSYLRISSGVTIPLSWVMFRGSDSGTFDDIRFSPPDLTAKTMAGVTWDGTTAAERQHVYLNGQLTGKLTAGGESNHQRYPLIVGRPAAEGGDRDGRRLAGRLYGLMLYSDLMTEHEVTQFSRYFGFSSSGGGGTDGGVAQGVLIAAADAPESVKEKANVVCAGINDHTQIQAALNSLSAGQRVFLSEGQFNVGGTIVVPDATGIIGAGKSKTTIKLQDAGSRYLTDYWWRRPGGANVMMTTAFIDDESRSQYQSRDVELRQFTLVGNTDELLPGNQRMVGLLVTSCEDSVVSDVDVNDINWHEPAAIDPSAGFGIVTRYVNRVDIIRCNPKRAQYECLGMYDDSINTRFIDCYPQDAGRTVTQVHRGCVDSWIIRGHSRNTAYLLLADEQTKALTVHGIPDSRVINLRVVDHDVSCEGVGTGDAISWFGEQENCSYSGDAHSQNGAAAVFSGNVIGNFNVSGRFTSDSVGNSYALTLRGVGVRASNISVSGPNCRGVNFWDVQNIKLSDFSILASDFGLRISNLEGVEISEGSVISSGSGIFSSAATVPGKFHITNVSVETVSNNALSLAVAVAEGGQTVLRGLDLSRADGEPTAHIRHSKATLEGSRIGGLLLIRDATEVRVRFNQYSGIQYVDTTEQDNVVEYNLVTS